MNFTHSHQEGISCLQRAKVLDIIIPKRDISPLHWEKDLFLTRYYSKNLQSFLNEKISLKEEISTQASSVQIPQEILGKRGFDDLSTNFSNADKEELATLEKEPQLCRRKPLDTSPKTLEKLNFIESGQNKMKNHPGTIAEKIKRSCQKNLGQDSRLFIIATINLTSEGKEKFRQWTSTFNKNYKTWKLLKDFLGLNLEFGEIFVRMIHLFLSPEFKSEYEEWLEKAQMTQQTKMVLRDDSNKEFFMRKFFLILQENNENISIEINKSRKSLKLI